MPRKRKLIFILFFGLCASGCISATSQKTLEVPGIPFQGFPVLQGHTTETTTQLTVVAPKNKIISYFIRSESPSKEIQLRDFEVQRFEKNFSLWAVDRIVVSGLKPNVTYLLEIRSQYNELLDIRTFQTLKMLGPQLRFAAVSCANDQVLEYQQQIWNELAAKAPHVLFFLGDNVYVTLPKSIFAEITPQQLWQRYVDTRLRLQIFRLSKLIPSYAIWDDNDFGKNDGDENYKYKTESAEIFSQFFSQESDFSVLQSGPGTAHALRIAGQQFLLMDDRSFRTPNRMTSENETHWGKSQERWLMEELKNRTPSWILNGDQIFGGYHNFESLEGSHPKSFHRIMSALGRLETPVIFLTGDRHLTETMMFKDAKHNFASFEITASPIHSTLHPSKWNQMPNPRQLDGRDLKPNYIIINSAVRNRNFSINATSYSLNNEILFHRYFEIKKARGTDRLNTK